MKSKKQKHEIKKDKNTFIISKLYYSFENYCKYLYYRSNTSRVVFICIVYSYLVLCLKDK